MPFITPEKGPFSTPTRRLVATNFLQQLGFQATYFVGIIGCATYILGAGALEISVLVLCLNAFLVIGSFVGGAVIDAIGPRHPRRVAFGHERGGLHRLVCTGELPRALPHGHHGRLPLRRGHDCHGRVPSLHGRRARRAQAHEQP